MINKTDMLQDIERVLVSEEELRQGIADMGKQLAEEYRGKCPIVIGSKLPVTIAFILNLRFWS